MSLFSLSSSCSSLLHCRMISRLIPTSRRIISRTASNLIQSRSAIVRTMSSSSPKSDGIVLLIDSQGKINSSKSASINSESIQSQWINSRASSEKPGQIRTFYPQSNEDQVVVVVSTGKQRPAPTTASDKLPEKDVFLRNELSERTRLSIAKGVKELRDVGAPNSKEDSPTQRCISVDPTSLPHSSAVGAHLGLYKTDYLKTKNGGTFGKDPKLQAGKDIEVIPLGGDQSIESKKSFKDEGDQVKSTEKLSWYTGEVYAKAQNWARELGETPANLMTPTIFCERVTEAFKGLPNVKIDAFDEAWAKSQNMNTFLSVTAGTATPAKFLQIKYDGAKTDVPTLAFVGKGITFDSGGISLKGGAGMKLMRADMLGAGTVVAATLAIAQLGLPLNIVCCTPLCENMPSGTATKPGDLIVSKKGLTVEVDNTDAEGRLVLADALTYVSQEFKPHTLIDVATLTGAILHALGHVYSGTFVEDETLWQELKSAGEAEHDRFWRMPGSEDFLYSIQTSNSDLVNRGTPAGSACAAVFLKQFVEGLEDRDELESGKGKAITRWAHVDIAGTMESDKANDYQLRALTGRPTRALVEFARRFAAQYS